MARAARKTSTKVSSTAAKRKLSVVRPRDRGGKAEKPAAPAAKARRRSAVLTGLRRQEIIGAAVKLFSRRGFEATRAEDIAQTAKIAKGTLYLYFRSKEAIYSAAIAHAVHELQALSTERIGSATSFHEKLTAAIAVRLHFWTGHEALYRLLITLGREARHRRQTNHLLRSGQQHLLAIFTDGVGAGELPASDYSALAWAVLDMVRGATERRMDRLHTLSVEGDAEAIAGFALRSAGLPMC